MLVKITRTFTAPVKGIGKPDYTRVVSGALERKGLLVDYGEGVVIFARTFSAIPSLMSWVRPPLAAGNTAHLVNVATGIAMPYTVPQGYTLTFLESEGSASEDYASDTYYEPATPPGLQLSASERFGSGRFTYAQAIAAFTTATLDPTAASSHQVDSIITNLGLGALSGGVSLLTLLKPVGTAPLPNVKTVKCKHCGHEHSVPVATSIVTCPECGKLTIYRDLSKYRGTQ